MTVKAGLKKVVAGIVHYKLLGITILSFSIGLSILIVITGPEAEPQTRTEKAWPVSEENEAVTTRYTLHSAEMAIIQTTSVS